jgi:hypothetical protein
MNIFAPTSARFGILPGVFLAALLCVTARTGSAEEPAAETPPASEWSATYTRQKGPFQIVVSKRADWETVWNVVFGDAPVPEVDFGSNVVACVFLGTRPTGGYRVEFGELFVRGKQCVIPYTEVKPTGLATMALTQPCAMKVFKPKPGLQVVIEKMRLPEKPAVPVAQLVEPAQAGASMEKQQTPP